MWSITLSKKVLKPPKSCPQNILPKKLLTWIHRAWCIYIYYPSDSQQIFPSSSIIFQYISSWACFPLYFIIFHYISLYFIIYSIYSIIYFLPHIFHYIFLSDRRFFRPPEHLFGACAEGRDWKTRISEVSDETQRFPFAKNPWFYHETWRFHHHISGVFHSHGGTPIAGCFFYGTSYSNGMIWGPYFRKPTIWDFTKKKWFNQIIQHMDLLLNFQRENSPKLLRSLTQMKDPRQNQFPGSLW
jgi:hypothetical protein